MDKVKEKIAYYKILIPLLWAGLFVLGGGMFWLLNNRFLFKLMFLSSGIIFEVTLGISLIFLHKRIKKLIKEL